MEHHLNTQHSNSIFGNFQFIVRKIINFSGDQQYVMAKYGDFFQHLPCLRHRPLNRIYCHYVLFETNLKSLLGIISNMQNDFTVQTAETAFEFILKINESNNEISTSLKTEILVFLHFVLLICERVNEMYNERSVSIVMGSIEKIFESLPSN